MAGESDEVVAQGGGGGSSPTIEKLREYKGHEAKGGEEKRRPAKPSTAGQQHHYYHDAMIGGDAERIGGEQRKTRQNNVVNYDRSKQWSKMKHTVSIMQKARCVLRNIS